MSKNINRSGYEIRLDVLKLAEGMVTDRWSRQYDAAHQKAEKNNEPLTAPNDNRVSETLNVAEILYGFVNEKGTEEKIFGDAR